VCVLCVRVCDVCVIVCDVCVVRGIHMCVGMCALLCSGGMRGEYDMLALLTHTLTRVLCVSMRVCVCVCVCVCV